MRVLVAAFGDPGHVFPAISLGRALPRRGHEVTVETWEERRAAVEGAGLGFTAAEEYRTFPPPEPGTDDGRHAADAARALLPLIERLPPPPPGPRARPPRRRRGAGAAATDRAARPGRRRLGHPHPRPDARGRGRR